MERNLPLCFLNVKGANTFCCARFYTGKIFVTPYQSLWVECCDTGPWCQASVCERLVLSSAFGLGQNSRNTRHSRTCCYATSCRPPAESGGLLRADEIWLSSGRQVLACPRRQTAKCYTMPQ